MRQDNENSGYEGTTQQPTKEEIAPAIYKLNFAIRKSIRYHSKRRRFFANWHNATNALAAISGSSAFVAILSNNSLVALWLSAIVAVASTCDLVMGFSDRSRVHDDLSKRFSRLLNEVIKEPHTGSNLIKWQAERISIEAEEPTFLTLLVAICENEELLAQGHYNRVLRDIGWRRKLADWLSFDGFHEQLLSKQFPE